MTIKVKQLRKGSWYLVVRWKGKKFVKRVADTKKQAEEIQKDLERELQFRGYGALEAFKPKGKGHGLTVSSYSDRWIDELKRSGLKPSTIDSYELQLTRHIKPFFENLPLADITYSRVKDFINEKLHSTYTKSQKEGAKQYPYTKDSIRIMVATLRAMVEEAVRDELLESNPVHGLGKFYGAAKKLRDNPDPFSLEELHAVEAVAGEWLPFLLMQSRTGARVGEAIALQWPDIDFRTAQAFIRRTMPINRKVGTPKSISSTRSIDLSPELIDALQSLQKTQREYWFKEGKELPAWVFCKRSEQAPDYSVWRRAFGLLCRKAKVRERRPHDLRHSYACLNLAAGKPITYVSAQLGHKNPQITLSIYARWVPGGDSGDKDVMDKQRQQKRQQMATGEEQEL
ncbi:MAG: site-specific integrase [Acidobacteria bacterium]|nr:site-specific integrase [Acidobacteriota bacterium]